MSTEPLSELAAVNKMLVTIFEQPVNSLDNPSVSDAGIAKSVLDEVRREVLLKGWDFNTERRVTLVREASTNYVPLPNNTLFVDTEDDDPHNVTQRGSRLYDKDAKTFAFTRDVVVTIRYLLAWEDLPEAAKHYVMIAAARRFQATQLPGSKDRYTEEQELNARAIMEEIEGEAADANMFTDSWSVASALER